jgi:hypothetical protein
LIGFTPQAATKIDRMMNGVQARNTWPPVYMSFARPVLLGSPSKCQLSFGCQKRRNTTRQTMEVMEAMMSGSRGPTKLAVRNWATAKEPPLTRAAGQTSRPFFHPLMRTTM